MSNLKARINQYTIRRYHGGITTKFCDLPDEGEPKELNRKEKESRKAKQKAARASRRKNRRK